MKTLNINDNKTLASWSDFIFKHPHGNIFQTHEFYQVCLKTKNYEPIVISIENDNKITGILLAVIQKEHSGFKGKFSARSIIIGGPIIEDNNLIYLEQILEKYVTAIKGKAIYTQFRNLWDCTPYKEIFKKFGFKYEPHLDIIIELSDFDKLEQGISKNKKRNIVKSKNKGLIFQEVENLSDYEKSIDLIQITYQNIGLPCPTRDYFKHAYEEFFNLNRLKIFGAYLNGTMIGTRLELVYKNTIYDWFAGAKDEENNKYPNDFLIYQILHWGNHNKFKFFDFGGAGKPNKPYGVREHKLKFSNNLVEYGRFECIHNVFLYMLGKVGLKFYKCFYGIFK